ncbi:MAG: insulinase family protein [Thermodesulfovibrionia bacterium]|nr:insulinase family protein [Thermodesulfovibrionia bacterium]
MYKKIILDNGIPVVLENVREALSVTFGIWIKIGSRNESIQENGISHFLEHMFFKGTGKRTSKDIAVEIDSLGGELNAFTSRETTTFYIKVLDEHIEKAVELITDIFLHSTFPEEEIGKEKGVIFEEIKMVEDTPEDYMHDLFNKSIWGESGLGQSVLGREEAIKKFTRDDLLNHVQRYYGKQNIVIACSGNFREESLMKNLNLTIGAISRDSLPKEEYCPEFNGQINIVPKKLSEVHLCLGLKGIAQVSEDRYAMYLLNAILGAGISSRLFQEIREKRGLAYSIYSFNISCFDTGVWAVYAGTDRKQVNEVIDIIVQQMRGLSCSLNMNDLEKAKSQLKGNLMLALESTNSKMINIAKQEIYYGRYFSPQDIIKAVEAVTLENLKELSQRLVKNSPLALTVYGPVKKLATQII